MVNYDVILGMYWLHDCFSTIDCRTRVVKFNFLDEPILEWKGEILFPRGRIISCLKACKRIFKGFLYHILGANVINSENLPSESVLVVREFLEVFPKDHLGIPPK